MENLHLYKDALKHAPTGYAFFKVFFNEDKRPENIKCIEVNQAFEKLTGISAEEITFRKLVDVAPDLIKEGFDCVSMYNKIMENGASQEFEIFSERMGKYFKVQVFSPNPSWLIASFIDVTKQKHQKADPEGVSGKLQALMKAMPDMLFIISTDGKYREVYASPEDKLMWPMDEIHHKTLFDLLPEEETKKHLAVYQQSIDEQTLKTINYSLEIAGQTMYFEARIVPFDQEEVLAMVRDVTEQTYTSRSLVETVEKYKRLVEEINDIIFSIDEAGFITYMSPVIKELTGISAPEYLGKYFSEFIHPEDIKALNKDFDLLKSGIEKPMDYRIKTKSGGAVWVRTSTRKVKTSSKGYEYRGLARDITENKIAEEELRDSEARFRALHNASFGGIAIHDKGIILECNQGLSEMTGYSQEELIGMNGLLLIANRMRDFVMDKILAGYEMPYEAVGVTKEGKEFPIRIEARNMPYHGRQVRVTEFRDISDQKKNIITQKILFNISQHLLRSDNLEDLLELARTQLNQLFDTTNFFMATYNPETDMLKRILFKDEKDDFFEWKAGDTFSGWVVKNKKTLCLKNPDIKAYAVKKGLNLKGSIPESWLGVPLLIQGKPAGVIAIQSYDDRQAFGKTSVSIMEMVAREISLFMERQEIFKDLKKAKEQAEESDRLKSAFLANMSHEIRTPMNGILGFAELLKEPSLTGEKQQKFIEIIEKSGHRMLNPINDLVDISKIESGQMDIHLSETNVKELLRFSHDFFKPEFSKKNIRFSLEAPDKDLVIRTDREKLDAILTNLLKNAVKYTDSGRVAFGVEQKGDQLEFFVIDTGIGIPKSRLEHIFDRFVQAQSSFDGYEGAGLGLAIVKAYVDMLEGSIWVESEKGKGSAFYFTLPVK